MFDTLPHGNSDGPYVEWASATSQWSLGPGVDPPSPGPFLSAHAMARVIIVEDNQLYAEDLGDYLQEVGHAVRLSSTANEMWAEIADAVPDVILLDLGLPDACGLALIPQLLEQHPAIRILVLTARTSADTRDEALRLGAHGYLVKPVKFMTLATHLQLLNEPALAE